MSMPGKVDKESGSEELIRLEHTILALLYLDCLLSFITTWFIFRYINLFCVNEFTSCIQQYFHNIKVWAQIHVSHALRKTGFNSFTTKGINCSFSLAKSTLPLQDDEIVQL